MKETLEKHDLSICGTIEEVFDCEPKKNNDALSEEQALAAAGSLDIDSIVQALQQQVQVKENENLPLDDILATYRGN
jgi:hypothetical protein